MNKMIKGSLAGATGIAVLMGGFGTYALWSDSTAIDETLESGVLTVADATAADWEDISGDVPADTDWPAGSLMVPGDKVEMTQPLDVTATGNNLSVKVYLTGVTSTFDDDLIITLDYGAKSITTGLNGANVDTDDDAATTGVDEENVVLTFGPGDLAALTADDSAVVTFELPSTVTDNQDSAVDLSSAVIHVDQVR